jgi:hypothetical protein
MKKPFIISTLFLLLLTLKLEMPFSQAINDVNPKKETLVLAIKELSLNPCRSSTLENKFKNYYLLDRDKISIKNSNKASLNFEFQLPDGKTFHSYLNRINVVLPEGRCFVKTECGIEVNELNVSPIFSGQIDGCLQSRIFLMYSNDYFVCVIDIDENESYIR